MHRKSKRYPNSNHKDYRIEKTEYGAKKILKRRLVPLRVGQTILSHDIFIETDDSKIFSLEVTKQIKERNHIKKISMIIGGKLMLSYQYGNMVAVHSLMITLEQANNILEIYKGKDFGLALNVRKDDGQMQDGLTFLSSQPQLKSVSITKECSLFINFFVGVKKFQTWNSTIQKHLPKFHRYLFLQELSIVRVEFSSMDYERMFVKSIKNISCLKNFRFDKICLENPICFQAKINQKYEPTNFLKLKGLDLNINTEIKVTTGQVKNKSEAIYWLLQFKSTNLTLLNWLDHEPFPFLRFKINDLPVNKKSSWWYK